MILTLKITWNVIGQAHTNETNVLVGPGQDIAADVPKILAVLVWSDNKQAHRINVQSMTIGDPVV
jgi:hypothetical protein